MRRLLIVLTVIGLVTGAGSAAAQELAMEPTIMLHVGAVTAKVSQGCDAFDSMCSSIVTSGDTDPAGSALYFVYLLAASGDTSGSTGLTGMNCGMNFTPGLSVFNWELCATNNFPSPGLST